MTEHDRRILAAQGYLELSLYEESRNELAKLPPEIARRPDVLEIHLLCLMAEKKWREALGLTENLIQAEPDEPGGFIHAAYILHEMGKTADAVEVLHQGPPSLRSKSVYYYNLGCYHACLGELELAVKLLRQSFEMDGQLRGVAKRDPDLQVLRNDLHNI